MKYWVIFALLAIVGSLGVALFFMLKSDREGKSRDQKMVLALALRVGVSIVLFVSILVAWKFGFIEPTGIPTGR
jgi:Protein of unknown function (DUF2909)